MHIFNQQLKMLKKHCKRARNPIISFNNKKPQHINYENYDQNIILTIFGNLVIQNGIIGLQ